jgi:hypothetical protein
MKPTFRTALIGLAGFSLLAPQAKAAVSLGSGSLAVAFYQVISGVVQNNTYTFNLGSASLYRENTGYNVSVSTINPGLSSSNIGADLATAFGSNWADSGTVRWMVIGGTENFAPVTNGDGGSTSYISRAVSTIQPGGVSTTIPTISATNRGILANNISAFQSGSTAASQTVGANSDGAFIQKSSVNTVEDFLPPATLGTYFGIGVNPEQTLAAGTITNNGDVLGSFEGALDIYRVIQTTDGADPTVGYSNTPFAAGARQYIGTLALDSAGNLSVIPEPSSALLGLAGTLGLCFRRRRNA